MRDCVVLVVCSGVGLLYVFYCRLVVRAYCHLSLISLLSFFLSHSASLPLHLLLPFYLTFLLFPFFSSCSYIPIFLHSYIPISYIPLCSSYVGDPEMHLHHWFIMIFISILFRFEPHWCRAAQAMSFGYSLNGAATYG